jgi:hypothetical protein
MNDQAYDYSDDILPAGDNLLAAISKLAQEQALAEAEVARCEKALEEANKALRDISWRRLPELMAEAGQTECTTATGLKIKVADHLRASIPEERKPEAFTWLAKHSLDSVIKSEMKLTFGRGPDGKRLLDQIFEFAKELEVPTEVKQSVHPSTLKSTLAECLKQGTEVPLDVFGAVVQREATVKPVRVKG